MAESPASPADSHLLWRLYVARAYAAGSTGG